MPEHKITRLVSTEGKTRTLEMDDGSIIERSGGSISWRNNNPGNLKFEHAGSADPTVHNPRTRDQALAAAQGRYQGVVDLDQYGNAIFESYEAGRAAKAQLLTRSHENHTVEQLLTSYSRQDYSGPTRHAEQAATIFAEGDRQGVDLRGKTVGQMSNQERDALADGIRRFEGWKAGEVEVTRAPTHQPATEAPTTRTHATADVSATTAPHASTAAHTQTTPGNAAILEAAQQHFFNEGRRYEYGRSDKGHVRPGRDASRVERDTDGDGRLGVDCSAFVWRGLKNAGYGVSGETAAAFTTKTLFNGSHPTAYARQHFDTVSAADARRPGGNLQAGDLLTFSNGKGEQHIGIFKGYDPKGHIQFIGSQGTTGPAEVTIRPNGYWDGGSTTIVGALRAKPEFRTHAPTQAEVTTTQHGHATEVTTSARHASHGEHVMREGMRGEDVTALQRQLNALAVRDAHGNRLAEGGRFGDHTRAAVKAFQQREGLAVDGVIGKETRGALSAQHHHQPQEAPVSGQAKGLSLNDPQHPDNALHMAIRGKLPSGVSEEAAAYITVQAKRNGIDSPGKLQSVMVQDGKAFVMGNTPGFRATIDLSQAPSVEQSSHHLLANSQQQTLEQQPAPTIGPR